MEPLLEKNEFIVGLGPDESKRATGPMRWIRLRIVTNRFAEVCAGTESSDEQAVWVRELPAEEPHNMPYVV